MYKVNDEQKPIKWQPNAKMGIRVGLNKYLRGGHLVVPIKWNPKIQAWELGQTVDAYTVRVYNDKLPLGMVTKSTSHTPKKFEDFVEAVFDPIEAEVDNKTETDETQKDTTTEDCHCEPEYEVGAHKETTNKEKSD